MKSVTNETNVFRLKSIKDFVPDLINLSDSDGIGKANLLNIHNDMIFLIQQAERAQELENENQWLYGRLNMISDIIEKGRKEMLR
ncbi:hypothetical protein [Sporosarcina newyorkensis]|uniref:hypothetical protein n=1 Tax=Sporosarcina newyorkensis TaxID=759851 RepID=UPI003CFE7786